MKFFFVSFAILVCSSFSPEYLKAQEVSNVSNEIPFDTEHGTDLAIIKASSSQNLSSEVQTYPSSESANASGKASAQLLQMQKDFELLEVILQHLSCQEYPDLISLEAMLVDLRGQCQSNFSREQDDTGKELDNSQKLFYNALLNQFLPKVSGMLDEQWEKPDETSWLKKLKGRLNELKKISSRAAVHLAAFRTKELLANK